LQSKRSTAFDAVALEKDYVLHKQRIARLSRFPQPL